MEHLSGLGIFFGGFGLMMASFGLLWWVSLYEKFNSNKEDQDK